MNARTSTAAPTAVLGDWRDLAVCRQVDPELFFPEADRGAIYEAQVAAAKRVCAVCPVRAECLAYALRAIGDGIAGGLTPEERRGLRRPARDRVAALVETARTATTRRQRADAGRALLDAGLSVGEVARVCEVSGTTARRWAVLARTQMLEVSA